MSKPIRFIADGPPQLTPGAARVLWEIIETAIRNGDLPDWGEDSDEPGDGEPPAS
jgi:hypothetical protein